MIVDRAAALPGITSDGEIDFIRIGRLAARSNLRNGNDADIAVKPAADAGAYLIGELVHRSKSVPIEVILDRKREKFSVPTADGVPVPISPCKACHDVLGGLCSHIGR